jgi:hypothetical protein
MLTQNAIFGFLLAYSSHTDIFGKNVVTAPMIDVRSETRSKFRVTLFPIAGVCTFRILQSQCNFTKFIVF